MNKCRFIFLLAAVCTLFSCRQGEVEHNISEMLDAVPTDAVIILPTDRLEQGIDALLDTTDVLRSLDWGHLKGKKAAVSFVYSGSLSPVLCIEAGKASPDTLKDVRRILGNVHELGLVAGHFSGQKTGISHNVLIVCRSEAVLASTIRHLEAGQSVLDAPGFTQAAASAPEDNAIFIRNSSWDKILPKNYLSGIFDRRSVIGFAKKLSDWTVVVPQNGKASVILSSHTDSPQFSNVLDKLPCNQGLMSNMVPQGAEFALSLPVSKEFRRIYHDWRYASSNLDKYEKELARLSRERGTAPLEWENVTDVREVGLVFWDGGRKALLVRTGKPGEDRLTPYANDADGFIPALYGSIFKAVDTPSQIQLRGWTICGVDDDLASYARIPEEMMGDKGFAPGKTYKFAAFRHGEFICGDNKGITMTNEQ